MWSAPSEVLALRASQPGVTTLTWQAPAEPGGLVVLYRTLQSSIASDFLTATCLQAPDPTTLSNTVAPNPASSSLYFFLIQARSGCPDSWGTLGAGTSGVPRIGVCP
jgi:hypothetical protein